MRLLKSIAFIAITLVFSFDTLLAQSPMAFNFQGIARDMSGQPLANKTIGLEFALIQGNPQGPIMYLESHQVTTNENALFSVAIGRGFVRFGDIATIDWSQGPFFMRTALDETGGENFSVVGTSELLSVPFALYAVNSGSGDSKWQSNDSDIYYDGGNVGIGTNNPSQKLHLKNGNLYIENPGNGIIMKSPDGQCWRQTVSNNGETVWTPITCPSSTGNEFPSLSMSPSSLQFAYDQNQLSMTLLNNGNEAFNWSLAYPIDFLNVTPAIGSLVPNGSTQLSVVVDRSSMPAGLNNYTIELSTNLELESNIQVLVDNNPPSYPPILELILPNQPALFAEGEPITFSADVTDQDSPNSEIEVSWESNLDGEFYSNTLDVDGNIAFETDQLSKGIHTITVTATDADDLKDVEIFQLSTLAPSKITLLTPTKSNGNVQLSWLEYENSDFLKYDIYRTDANCTDNGSTLLTQIDDKAVTSFEDTTAPLEYQVCYFIVVTNSEGLSRKSNVETVEFPSGYIFNFTASDFLLHPYEDFVYVIDRGGQKLIKFDYNNSEVITEKSLLGQVKYSDIADNGFGVEIAIPSNDGHVYIYDADDLELKQTIITDLAATCAVQDEVGNVIVSVQPSPWWEDPIRTFARSNGINLAGGGERDDERLRKIPGKNEYITISEGVSPTDMNYYKFDDNGMFLESEDDEYHGTYPLDAKIFRISDDGTYVITGKSGSVYLANSSMEYKGELMSASLNYSDFAFSEDGAVIYAATSNRKSIQIGAYPSLIRSDEILTKGYPAFVVRKGDKLITLSKQGENSVNSGVEVIQL